MNGTVLFASAAHGWCFSLRQFADIYGPLLGINKNKLVQYMWGDYVYKEKTKTVGTWTPSSSIQPIFVKMVLSTIWKVYKSVYKRNEEALQTILTTAGITLTPRELKTPDDNVLIKLNDFLKNVNFNIDNFSRECKNIESSNILLEINATLEDGSITTYKVPLSLNGTCS